MTLEEFAAITAERIPTPEEFVAFAEGQKWGFKVNGKAALLANPNDPLAVATARMLGREPYRSNVLEFLARRSGRIVAREADNPENVLRVETPTDLASLPRDPAGLVTRSGVCTAKKPLPGTPAGKALPFEECSHAERKGHVYYRVFTGTDYKSYPPERFREMFEERT